MHPPRIDRILRLSSLLCSLGIPTAVCAQTAADSLQCKVLRAKPLSVAGVNALRIEIEVKNKSRDTAIEPLVFKVETKKGKDVVTVKIPRALPPFAARRGRPVRPGGRERFELQISNHGGDRVSPRAIRVTATHACPSSDKPFDAKLNIRPVRHERVSAPTFQEPNRKIHATVLAATNPTGLAIDAVLELKVSKPATAVALIGIRIPADPKAEIAISKLPDRLRFVGGGDGEFDVNFSVRAESVRVESVRVLDMCAVGEISETSAWEVLANAYEKWVRWPDEHPTVSGRFVRHVVKNSFKLSGSRKPAKVEKSFRKKQSGRFSVTSEGSVRVELDSGTDHRGAVHDIRKAFADLLRRSPSEMQTDNKFSLVAPDRVSITGAGYEKREGGRTDRILSLHVKGGRIVGQGRKNEIEDSKHWDHGTIAGVEGYVVTRRGHDRAGNAAQDSYETYSYDLVDNVVVPTLYESYLGFPYTPEPQHLSQLRFTGFRIGNDEALAERKPEAPKGAGVDLVRDAWNAVYRYPEVRLQISCSIAVSTPGTDWTWSGLKKVQGKLDFVTPFGLMNVRHTVFKNAESVHADKRSAHENAITDRFRMWGGRDLQRRKTFEDTFDGATIYGPDEAGFCKVVGSPSNQTVKGVTVHNGLITGIHWISGKRTYRYSQVEGVNIATEVRTGGETLRARYTKVGEVDGEPYLFPTEMRFERVFGDDWGPEVIKLSRVKATPK